jgi:hypothetical protein
MNVKEAHIHVERGLQRYNANVYDYFTPEDIDLVLTKSQNRFIDSKFRRDDTGEGFQYDQGDLDDVEALVISNYVTKSEQDFNLNIGKTYLPYNYRYLIDAIGQGYRTCKYPNETGYDRESILDTNEYVTTYDLTPDNFTSSSTGRVYKGLKLYFNNTKFYDIEDSTSLKEGLVSDEELFIFISEFLGKFYDNLPEGVKGIYWEKYKGRVTKNSIIVVSDSPSVLNTVEFTGDDNLPSSADATEEINVIKTSSLDFNYEAKLRITNNDRKSSLLYDNAYSKTISRSPITTISQEYLIVNYDKRFIVISTKIDYIRIPKYVSLSLGIGFELREHTHERICDLAIEYIKNIIEQPSYDSILKDNMLRNE